MNLSSTIKSIQDIMRKDDGVDGDAQRLGQLTWMLFLKVFDQRETEWEDDAKDAGKRYRSPLPKQFRWRNWAAYIAGPDGKKKPQKVASEIVAFVNYDLFPALKSLDASKSSQHKVIRSVFEDANNYMKSGTQLLAVVEKLEEAIDFHDFKNRAQLGDVYEQLLNDLRGAGNAGEFYTPRAITAFMVDRVNPRLAKKEKVLDPACGTGGFLTAAIEHFRKQLSTKSSPKAKRAIEELICGIEKKQLPHLLCTTNMLLHGIDVPSHIEHKNTLSVGWNEWGRNDFVDCIVTNPPFGGYEDDSVGSGYHHLTKETADLFMQLIVKLLKEHGRAAVVLPDGFLFGDGIKAQIKERLLQQCMLHTIVRLPKGVFAPYTTIKTNLLFFTKGDVADDGGEHFQTETIWFYEHPYPAGYKSYSKTKPIRFEEFTPEIEWWGEEADGFSARSENEFAWKVDFRGKRQQALASARPYWTRAEKLNNDAAALESEARVLRNGLVGTGQTTLRCGTLWALSHILAENSPAHSGKSRRRWCPACYRDWGPTSYEPLIWEIDILSYCPVHDCRLESFCPSCGSAQRYKSVPDKRRECHSCGAALSKGAVWERMHPFLQWVDKQIIDLVEFCASPCSEPLPYRVFQEFVAGLDKTLRGKRASALGALVKFYACRTRLRGRRVAIRSLINLCAIQGVSVKELLAAPREVSGPLLFDQWAGLTYLPLPSARQAQKIYVAGKCLTDFLKEEPAYLPPMSLLLGGFGVQLLAIRDIAAGPYDSYEARYSVQGDVVTQRLLHATYQSARNILRDPSRDKSRELRSIVARVAGRAGVTSVLAKQAVRSASASLTTQAKAKIQQYEQEMPVEAAVAWFVRSRQCLA